MLGPQSESSNQEFSELELTVGDGQSFAQQKATKAETTVLLESLF